MKREESVLLAIEEQVAGIRPRAAKRTLREFEEIFVSEFVSVTGGILAGFLLAHATNRLEMIPGILILMPGFLEMRGNISGALAARLSTALHLGWLKKHPGMLRSNIAAASILAITLSAFLGIVAYIGTLLFFRINYPKIIIVALVAGIISNFIMIPITTKTTLWLFKKGHDPDNIMGPYITTIGDILSVVSLLIGMMVV
ncbi:MAG: magnesium transporter [Candidatus Woesearchaeota archaeon]